jgi:drug/metabolite transporter (DMT)-like permease
VVTIALAFACFGDRLAPLQLSGGALVLAAVVILQAGRRPGLATSSGT